MNKVGRDIFKAVHEGKWLSIEYRNKKNEETHYWIGIKSVNPVNKTLLVDGLHVGNYQLAELNIYIDSITSSKVVEGTYYEVNRELVQEIKEDPYKFESVFSNVANMKILNYLIDCNKLDTLPYKTEYTLITKFDGDKFINDEYVLTDEQYTEIVRKFQSRAQKETSNTSVKKLGLNELSVNTPRGLYVLAYSEILFDPKKKILVKDEEVTLNREFTIDKETRFSIHQFMQPEDQYLLEDFKANAEEIKDLITAGNPNINGVDDMPYLVSIGFDNLIDLEKEYGGITKMFEEDKVTAPIQAFFGDLTKRPMRKRDYPLVLMDRQVNLDQLLAINNAMKYPLAYVQGPPGTGKTTTIVNTILTAFFNRRTVLFASYNNHPIDGVCKTLQSMKYNGRPLPFPIIRLGNNDKVAEAIVYMRELYRTFKDIPVYDTTLEKNRHAEILNLKEFTKLMKRYEDRLDLLERKETLEDMINSGGNLTFQYSLQSYQLPEINKLLDDIGEITNEDALALLPNNEEEIFKYLNFASIRCIKRLGEPKNKQLLDIIRTVEIEDAVQAFNKYLADEKNLKQFMRIFPVVATTCISAQKLGEPEPYFDMVIIDEASQCNTATSLVPIIRGQNLMLVGDPQQLNPVIVIDPLVNAKLRKKYGVSDDYDYVNNSVYKTFLACDAVSDETLLSYHYRCDEKIIGFNNKKYYNNKLNIKTDSKGENPLIFVDVTDDTTTVKNTAPREVENVIKYARQHPEKEFGVITPFVNQKQLLEEAIESNGIKNLTCGTVHAFQGDEKDIVIFSLALTDKTRQPTYNWLKNNKELINVATSRAKEKLIILGSEKDINRLHIDKDDDIYELIDYTKNNGETVVTPKVAASRALGIKPYSTKTEAAFLENLNHAMDNIVTNGKRCKIVKEVPISQVFENDITHSNLFYTGRFDFVVYERVSKSEEIPILAIELDGKEHIEDELVMKRDAQKNQICRAHGFELIRIENSYARRYNYIKDILIQYFSSNIN